MIKKQINVDGIKEKILSVKLNTDTVYFFSSGKSAEIIEKKPSYNPTQFNVFGIYDSKIFNVYKEIIALLKEEGLNKEIAISKSEYYISSDYLEKSNNKNFVYDFGGMGIPCFNGLISLQEKEIVVYLNDKREVLKKGTLLFFESGQEIRYEAESIEMVQFHIAPSFMIQVQYPFKWIPIGV